MPAYQQYVLVLATEYKKQNNSNLKIRGSSESRQKVVKNW